ncbi:MAG: hypothetical protein ACE5HA_17805 [Anaerolineae bacterium]
MDGWLDVRRRSPDRGVSGLGQETFAQLGWVAGWLSGWMVGWLDG